MCVVVLVCVTGISGVTTELAGVAAVSRAIATIEEVGVFRFGFEGDWTGAGYAGVERDED